MQKKRGSIVRSTVAISEILLIVSLSFAVAFLLSEEVGVASAGTHEAITLVTKSPLVNPGPIGLERGSEFWVGKAGEGATATGGEFKFSKALGNVASGKATFGFAEGSTAAGVTGALAQGLFWGGILYVGIKVLAPMLGVGEETSNALATAALAGGVGGGAIKAFVSYMGKGAATAKIGPLTAGQAGFVGGVAIAAIVFLVMYKKEKTQLVNFQCLPWEPPLKGEKCEECNNDPFRPCTEYRCKSLGQGCQLLNPNSGKEQCTWVAKNDVNSPKITPWTEPLRPIDARYVPDTAVRPPAIGSKIVTNKEGGCLDAFTPLQFGIITNEPAQCKLDYNHTQSFDDMQFYFGGDNYYAYNHTQKMRLPGPGGDVDLAPLLRNDGSFALYTRCRDANGNENVDEYSISFCVNQGPDTTPPLIEGTSILSGSPVQYKVDQLPIEVYVSEPAECRWSTQSKAFDDMENQMQCPSDVSEFNSDLSYTCTANLTGVKDHADNTFFFRCKDQPGKDEKERNVMVQSHELLLKGSQALTIDSVGPNGILAESTSAVRVTLQVETSNGAQEGVSICAFSNKSTPASDFITMFSTKSYTHSQQLSVPAGTYTAHFRCVDAGGNVATASTSFTVQVDKQAPAVTRVYRDQALKVTTDEDAECRYSTTSCNFAIADGLRMQYQNVETKTRHFADWKPGVTYYVRCVDSYGNEPDPAACSVIARPVELAQASAG